ncbi:MAG: DUF3783 domain-containing protein [Clostridia bacterium]|nr:DUF3783 domain-containing protein [Clostridia bacterium]
MKPLLLIACMAPDRLMRVSMLAVSLGIEVKAVRESEWNQPLSALCGMASPLPQTQRAVISEEIMVMARFEDALVDRFLRQMRQSGLEPVRLKAVLTRYNQHWPLAHLALQLKKEAALMAGRNGK